MTAALAPSALKLQRETFELSRSLEFFSERELTAQIGHPRHFWPAALLKELLDNALDACENAGIAPVIVVELQDDALIVTDNGPGLPLATLEKSLDYTVRVSDKTGYVSPSRGQQGNALKTLWAAPFVATGTGIITVETATYRREVRVTLDRIAQVPVLELIDTGPSDVKTGTKITVHWSDIASSFQSGYAPSFYSVVFALTDFNPHCTLITLAAGIKQTFPATEPYWRHWRPDRPTSSHWYTPERCRALVALLLNAEQRGGRARSVNEFIRDFHGLSGTARAKAVAQAANLTGTMLHDLVAGGDVDMSRLACLLAAMQAESRPVKPEALGTLGQSHCAIQLARYGASPDSIEYRRAQGTTDGLPYGIEVAFGVKRDSDHPRTLRVGINCSPTLDQPFSALTEALSDARCTSSDPVMLLVHLACPLVQFVDRGKARAMLPEAIDEAMKRLVKLATARFTQAKRKADSEDRMTARHLEELRNANTLRPMTVKAAAWQVMEPAYLKASSGGTLPANARQIMYAARPLIIELTGKASPWSDSAAFTQRLLPDYIDEHSEQCSGWDVVFDDRGHFTEPHTGRTIGIGTLAVRDYIRRWHGEISDPRPNAAFDTALGTTGPALRYRFALFVEKEGFNPLLERARIAERYDLALLSTKGMSVTAARQLVERLSEEGVTTLVLHDFDKSGFTIAHTLQNDTRRYRFRNTPKVIDLGLRLADVEAMNLDSEVVDYGGKDPRPGLIERGATPDEAAYLVTGRKDGRWIGRRVELNAMDAHQFVVWLEAKLQAHGVTKFVPDEDATLKAAWRRAWRINALNRVIAEATKALPEPPEPPAGLGARVRATLERSPALRWDEALLLDKPR
ncbi:MAG: DUF2399 domain-containing protein [Candidatus Competibacter denitrificans]